VPFAIVIALLAHASCSAERQSAEATAKSKTIEEDRTAKYFSHVVSSAVGDVHFTQGEKPSIKVVGREEFVKKTTTEIDGETLYIKTVKDGKQKILTPKQFNLAVYITSPDLTNMTLRGVGDVEVSGNLNTDTLDIGVSGVGDVKVSDLVCDRLIVSVKGTGDVDIAKARCKTADFTLKGVGDVSANLIKTDSTNIVMKGVGDMDVRFNDCNWANCRLSGVGDLTASGTLKTFEKHKKNIGDIDIDDLHVETKK